MIEESATEVAVMFEHFKVACEAVAATIELAFDLIRALMFSLVIYRHTIAEFFIPFAYFYLNIIAHCRSPPTKK